MTTEGLIGYEALIEHHKEHHKIEDALIAERNERLEELGEKIDDISELKAQRDTWIIKCDALLAKVKAAQPAIELAILAVTIINGGYTDDTHKYSIQLVKDKGNEAITILEGLKDEEK